MQNQEKIIQAIVAYLEREILLGCAKDTCASEYIAKQIYEAAIAPHLESVKPKDFPYTELFDHMANEHGLTLTNTELGDIVRIARK